MAGIDLLPTRSPPTGGTRSCMALRRRRPRCAAAGLRRIGLRAASASAGGRPSPSRSSRSSSAACPAPAPSSRATSSCWRQRSAQRGRRDDAPQLINVVQELAIAANVPMPKVYLIDDTAPNAFATGRDPQHASMAITTGLLEKLDREELQGVIGHELSHVRNYDIRFSLLVGVLVGSIALLADFFLRFTFWGGVGGALARPRQRAGAAPRRSSSWSPSSSPSSRRSSPVRPAGRQPPAGVPRRRLVASS